MVFTTSDGRKLDGQLIHLYPAFEGGMRYIFESQGKEYRCVMNEKGEYIEFVV